MSRPVLAFTLGMAVITLAAAIVIAKAQVNANISYGWILTAPWVVPTLLTISFLLFFMALREWRGFRKGFWRVVTFIVPPYSSMDGEERPKDKAQQSAPVPILLPDKRPMIAPTRYGPTKPISHHQGLHLTNEREPAYDIRIDAFRFGNHTVTFDAIDRLAKEDNEQCLLAQISEIGAVQVHMLDAVLSQWQERTNTLSIKIPLHIVYRGSEGPWYRTVCELERNFWKKDTGISVRFIRQEPASEPNGRRLWALKETWEPEQLPQ